MRRLLVRMTPIYVCRAGMISGGWWVHVGPWRTRVLLSRRSRLHGRFPNGSTWCSGFHRRPKRVSR